MDPLQRKKLSRSALRNHAKKIVGEIDGLLDNFSYEGVQRLLALKANLAAQLEKVEASNGEVEELIVEEEALVTDIEDSCAWNDAYFDIMVKIDDALKKHSDTKVFENKASSDKSPPEVIPNSSDVIKKREVKLPKIELKSFDGDILNWQTFWDQFESSVHSNISLSDVDKFSYLKSLLEGPAEDCISGLT